ncbi:MAG: SdpI family protein [Bacteroidetes bacterium]|nr:SdpI family protein [Bacteroidota bacterium]
MKLKDILLLLLALVPLVYVGMQWNHIPAEVPTHFDLHGNANGWSSRAGFMGLIGFMCVLNIGMYLLLVNIEKIDPKRATADRAAVFNKIATGMTIFLTALNIVIIISGLNPDKKIADKALLPLMGLMFIFLGNYMHSVKPNYFVGIRIPWTLHDEDNWKKTHRLAGTIWFAGGILITLLSLAVSAETGAILMQIIIGIMVLIPIAYSFILFKKKQSSNTQS